MLGMLWHSVVPGAMTRQTNSESYAEGMYYRAMRWKAVGHGTASAIKFWTEAKKYAQNFEDIFVSS